MFNGTAANALSLSAICQSFNAVICHSHAHTETDECGAPELFTGGAKTISCKGVDGKLTQTCVEKAATHRRDLHFSTPRALTVTQSSEFGLVYSQKEIHALAKTANSLGLKFHMDGARFANALVACKLSPAEMTWKSGVEY